MKTDVNVPVPTESNMQNKLEKKEIFVGTDEKNRIRIHKSVYGSKDPDPYQMSRIWNTGTVPS
jgi:hypothetical protein